MSRSRWKRRPSSEPRERSKPLAHFTSFFSKRAPERILLPPKTELEHGPVVKQKYKKIIVVTI
jgi:hypothetical protein